MIPPSGLTIARQPLVSRAQRGEASRLVTVGGAVAHPAAGSKPDVRAFPSSGSSVYEPLSQVLHWGGLLAPGAWSVRVQKWTYRPVFSPKWTYGPSRLP